MPDNKDFERNDDIDAIKFIYEMQQADPEGTRERMFEAQRNYINARGDLDFIRWLFANNDKRNKKMRDIFTDKSANNQLNALDYMDAADYYNEYLKTQEDE